MELTWYRLRAGGNEGTLGSENLVQGCRVERGELFGRRDIRPNRRPREREAIGETGFSSFGLLMGKEISIKDISQMVPLL